MILIYFECDKCKHTKFNFSDPYDLECMKCGERKGIEDAKEFEFNTQCPSCNKKGYICNCPTSVLNI